MEEAQQKSAVLIEAFPYIRKFRGRTMVIKYGGSAMEDDSVRHSILQDIAFMSYVGMRPIVVHGGGPAINAKMKDRGIKPRFVDGLRVTDEAAISIVSEALGELNAQIVREIRGFDVEADGFGPGCRVIKAKQSADAAKLGLVGEVSGVDTATLIDCLQSAKIPVISSMGTGSDGQLYNINADDVASGVAVALKAQKLVLLTDVPGIFEDPKDEDSLIHSIPLQDAEGLIRRNIVSTGMIPKVRACIKACAGGVRKVHIVSAKLKHSLLLEIFTDKGVGTEIVR